MQPFAVLERRQPDARRSADELAADEIMCLGNCSLAVPQRVRHRAHAPYMFGTGPTPEQAVDC